MKNRFWILALLAISFTGCYTSFAPRDYEQESYGNFNEDYYNSPEIVSNYDSLDFLDEEYFYEEPQEITIVNNYPPEWAWDYYSPVYVSANYGYWGGFYDPYYGPNYGSYYPPYYGGNICVYGDAYFGGSYYGGYGNSYYPSQTRNRKNRSHWTSLRNNGGRRVANVSRDRGTNGNTSRGNTDKRDRETYQAKEIRGFDLDKDLRVARNSGNSSSSKNRDTGIRTASIRKSSEAKTARRTSDLDRRRVTNKTKEQVKRTTSRTKRSNESRRVTKRTTVSNSNRSAKTSQTRSKRIYSSSGTSKNRNSSGSSRSYHTPTTRSSNRSSNVSKSQRNSGSSRNHSTSSNSSRSSSSSRSSYSTPSRSTSRPSVSKSSSSSSRSSRSSSSKSSSSSNKSSRGRR